MWLPISLDLDGEHTGLLSPLCRECPHGVTGCCASPPGFDWSDLGRVLTLGGREWLKEQLAAGRIVPLQQRYGAPVRGLQLQRVENPVISSWPTKCTYHGEQGCTIGRDRRPATCNYYVCDQAYDQAGPEAAPAREAHALLQTLYGRWDLEIAATVAQRWPQRLPWDEQAETIFAVVEAEYQRLLARDRSELQPVAGEPRP